MVFEVLKDAEDELCFATSSRARRSRGVLYALAPWFIYLFSLSVLFALELASLIPPAASIANAVAATCVVALLTPLAYALGRRACERVNATEASIRIWRTPSWGHPRLTSIPVVDLSALGIDPSIRSLGADLLLVAVQRDGRRIGLVEGDPHLGQLRQLAGKLGRITRLPL